MLFQLTREKKYRHIHWAEAVNEWIKKKNKLIYPL